MLRPALVSAALICVLASAHAATKADDTARPRDPTANQPSESGAQSTTPKGAVTGAGQPQGQAQPDTAKSANSATTGKTKKGGKQKSRRAKTKRSAAP